MESKDDNSENKKITIQTDTLGHMKNRILYFDIIKLFGILCVVWAHVMQNLTVTSDYWLYDPVCQFVISFHMPLFMMISGYFAYSSLFKPSLFDVVQKKFVQLVIPSIVWGLIVTGLAMVIHRDFSVDKLKFMAGNTLFSYWFLKSLFFCYLLALLGVCISRFSKYLLVAYIILILLLSGYLDYSNAMSMMPYFICGIILHHNIQRLSGRELPLFLLSLSVFLYLFFSWALPEYNMYTHPYGFSELQSFCVRTIIGLAGSLCWILIIKHLVSRIKCSFWDKYAEVGRMTMGIYLIQLIFAESLCKMISSHVNPLLLQIPPPYMDLV